MREKKNKVQFPCIPDDVLLEIDDRVLYTNDELLTSKKNQWSEVEELDYFPRPNRAKYQKSSDTFTSPTKKEKGRVRTQEVKLPTPASRKKSYQAPERPKGYVYPTDRMSNIGNSGFSQRPLGAGNNTKTVKAWSQLPLPVTVEVKNPLENKFERPGTISSRVLSSNIPQNKHTSSPRNFDTLAQDSRAIQEGKKKKESISKGLGKDYFERKRQTLFERGSY
ncbi:hypothetical protein OZX60_05345 [Streptococcaceae bacterium ESL0687]|nr:hypothetical protein OZX60_05345 [Streptococcaceae bacterium ESL0687]